VIGVIGLGTNLGDRVAYLVRAREALERAPGIRVEAASSIVETDAHGPPQPRYLNAAVRIETSLEAEPLLEACLAVERSLGRVRGERWGPRTIDLDILYLEGVTLGEGRVLVPHPRLLERSFALGPLLEVMPELVPRWGGALTQLGGAPPAYRAPAGTEVKGWTSFDRRT
jgi:2-amino-4-hydroxy-6-hydroxymethyldihydropteridine diphosphokinase